MLLGLSLAAFTNLHVIISLIAIVSGIVVFYGLLNSQRMDSVTGVFLLFAALTEITAFMLPYHGQTPAVTVGIVSSVILIVTILARYAFGMRSFWRPVYVIGAVMSLWFNLFVLVAQSFGKIPALHALAPKGSEPPFAVAQGLVLLIVIVLGYLSVRRFRPRG